LFVLRLDIKPIVVVGATPGPFRRVGIIPGGTFDGDRLSGTVIEGGSDWQDLYRDGTTRLDVRLVLKTRDDALIAVKYQGVRSGPPDELAAVDRGEDVDPSTYYFRTNPLFETAAPRYDWLNHIVCVGIGYRQAKGVIYSLFEVL
jgi:hypothetical protein